MYIHNVNYTDYVKSYTNNKKQNNVKNTFISEPKKLKELSNVFYYPVNFSSKTPRIYSPGNRKLAEESGSFKISKLNGIPCPACGKKMMNLTNFQRIADELASVPPDKYLEYLGQYTEYMRPIEESVYKEISELSQKPNHSKDIRTLLVELRNTKLPILEKVQLRKINKMRSLARTLPDNEQKVLISKINNLCSLIRKNNPEAPFRRKIMLDRISKVNIKNPKKYAKLQQIAASFPTSSDMDSAWIVKYSGKNKYNEDWDSYSIALRFLSSSIANTDHIIAYDLEKNHDDISNYMSMHSACNSRKSNKPFLQWLNEDRNNRIQYMKNYFDVVNELIKNKKIKSKKYKNYVAYATETVFEASKGQVKLYE